MASSGLPLAGITCSAPGGRKVTAMASLLNTPPRLSQVTMQPHLTPNYLSAPN